MLPYQLQVPVPGTRVLFCPRFITIAFPGLILGACDCSVPGRSRLQYLVNSHFTCQPSAVSRAVAILHFPAALLFTVQ